MCFVKRIYYSPTLLRSVGNNLGLLLTLHTLYKSEQYVPSNIKDVGSQPPPPRALSVFPFGETDWGFAPNPGRILIKALATLPPRLGMAEYGLGIGLKGKAFIKIKRFTNSLYPQRGQYKNMFYWGAGAIISFMSEIGLVLPSFEMSDISAATIWESCTNILALILPPSERLWFRIR